MTTREIHPQAFVAASAKLGEGVKVGAYAVVGALSLYLDFINLFFFLLRFTGSRRD